MLPSPINEAIQPNDAELVQELLLEDSAIIVEEIVLGFPSASLITVHDNVDAALNVWTQNIKKDLILGWSKSARAQGGEFEWGKLTLTVEDFSIDLELTYNDRDIRAYRKMLQKTGTTADEISLVMYLVAKAVAKMRRETGIAFWQGKRLANVAQRAPLRDKIDGIRKQAKALQADGIALLNAFGNVTSDNAMDAAEAQYDLLNDEMQENGSVTVCSYKFFNKWKKHWRKDNKGNPDVHEVANHPFVLTVLPHGNGLHYLLPLSEFGTDDALLTCRMEDLHMGYNLLMDWKVKDEMRTLWAACDISVGALFAQINEGYIVVNDVLVANS